MEISIRLSLPVAKKNNKSTFKTKGGRVGIRVSPEYDLWHRIAEDEIRSQDAIPEKPYTHVERLICVFDYPDHRRRDNDNLLASVQDFLCDVGVLKDDTWKEIEVAEIRGRHNPANVGVWVTIVNPK